MSREDPATPTGRSSPDAKPFPKVLWSPTDDDDWGRRWRWTDHSAKCRHGIAEDTTQGEWDRQWSIDIAFDGHTAKNTRRPSATAVRSAA